MRIVPTTFEYKIHKTYILSLLVHRSSYIQTSEVLKSQFVSIMVQSYKSNVLKCFACRVPSLCRLWGRKVWRIPGQKQAFCAINLPCRETGYLWHPMQDTPCDCPTGRWSRSVVSSTSTTSAPEAISALEFGL